jgi:hypothetical protein
MRLAANRRRARAGLRTALAIDGRPAFVLHGAMMPPLNRFKRFDVREMIRGGAEPFPFIRERVDELQPGEGLLVVAPFLPSPLIEKFGSEGFASKVERGAGADWLVYFWRETA